MRGEDASFRDYLLAMAAEVGLGLNRFRTLPEDQGIAVASAIESRFGDSVHLHWWGTDSPCDLPTASRHFSDDQGWALVDQITPDPEQAAWFVAENFGGGSPRCFVFEAEPSAVRAVLGNSHGFEYLLASRQMEWLIVEDHHSVVVVVGEAVVDRLNRLHD